MFNNEYTYLKDKNKSLYRIENNNGNLFLKEIYKYNIKHDCLDYVGLLSKTYNVLDIEHIDSNINILLGNNDTNFTLQCTI